MATEHLINQHQYEHIACITNASSSFTAAIDRLSGYRQALEENQIGFDETLVRYGDFTPESGYEQMKSLLSGTVRPDAVFVASDVVAIGAMAAIREGGYRIPQDIAVVGFDDVPFARYFDPPLTTVHLPARAMAHLACSLVMEMINGHRPAENQILLKSELVVRNSSMKS
jgi:DNA-binding LacI/PurR family transcriptional regulator